MVAMKDTQVDQLQWIGELRKHSEERLAGIPVPTSKEEGYRFTSVRDVSWDLFPKPLQGALPQIPSPTAACWEGEGGVVSIRSGAVKSERHVKDSLAGVLFQDLRSTLTGAKAGEIRPYLNCPQIFESDRFAQLACARWQNGVVLFVEPGARVSLPLRGLHWFDHRTGAFYHRTLLVASENSEVTYFDLFASGTDSDTEAKPMAVTLVQIVALSGAKVNYVQHQMWGPTVHQFEREHFLLHRDAQLNYYKISSGGEKVQCRNETECLGTGSRSSIAAAAKGDQKQHFDFWVNTRHRASHTQTAVDYWTVLNGEARSIFNGNLVIPEGSDHCEGYQRNKNLLLSTKGTVETLPKLEIFNDEVKCAHGASVSSVNPDQLYYLQSRGLSRAQAEKMLVDGFVAPVIEKLPLESWREWVSEKMGIQYEQSADN